MCIVIHTLIIILILCRDGHKIFSCRTVDKDLATQYAVAAWVLSTPGSTDFKDKIDLMMDIVVMSCSSHLMFVSVSNGGQYHQYFYYSVHKANN